MKRNVSGSLCALVLWAETLVSPAAQPVLQAIQPVSGGMQLSVSGDLGATHAIQSTTNLTLAPWVTLTNLVVSESPYRFVDSNSVASPVRFYRILQTSAPAGMALIPAGSFQMGDTFNEGFAWEVPVHAVYVSAVYLDQYEVTKALWDQVMSWSLAHAYAYDNTGSGKGPTHPVQTVDWFDVVKWCNARSEMEGRAPAYYTDAALTQVYRTGQVAPYVSWAAGYRLPTEAEWEKGARGGASGHRFPWSTSDTITEAQANYYSDSSQYSYDINPTQGYNGAFVDATMPYTSPVGSFPPNAYGLYDMAGNVWEWCWDYFAWYTGDAQTDPRGPGTGDTRIGRGGNWNYYAEHCRNAYRYGNAPGYSASNIGFRCALAPPN